MFFFSWKTNAKVKFTMTGHSPHSSISVAISVVLLLFVLFYVLSVCKCVLQHCHQVTTQLQLTNISYKERNNRRNEKAVEETNSKEKVREENKKLRDSELQYKA